jgi:PIN domain nuclease of toxin-antitoxin system
MGAVRYLLDTCTFLWLAQQPSLISAAAAAVIDEPANDLVVSEVTLMEVVLKHSAGRLPLPDAPRVWIPVRLDFHQLQLLSLTGGGHLSLRRAAQGACGPIRPPAGGPCHRSGNARAFPRPIPLGAWRSKDLVTRVLRRFHRRDLWPGWGPVFPDLRRDDSPPLTRLRVQPASTSRRQSDAALATAIGWLPLEREPCWTEAVAVGSGGLCGRRRT